MPEKPDSRLKRADFRPEKAISGLRGLMGGQTEGMTDRWTKVPQCSTRLCPPRGCCPKINIHELQNLMILFTSANHLISEPQSQKQRSVEQVICLCPSVCLHERPSLHPMLMVYFGSYSNQILPNCPNLSKITQTQAKWPGKSCHPSFWPVRTRF